MSKTGRTNHRRGTRGRPKAERHISIRSVRRDPPDLHKLSRAVIAIALREAELEAEAKAALPDGRDTPASDSTTDTSLAGEEVSHD
jgi:hypothetical protein